VTQEVFRPTDLADWGKSSDYRDEYEDAFARKPACLTSEGA
jgi:hypothetical protein